jgi:hypothetical protein
MWCTHMSNDAARRNVHLPTALVLERRLIVTTTCNKYAHTRQIAMAPVYASVRNEMKRLVKRHLKAAFEP